MLTVSPFSSRNYFDSGFNTFSRIESIEGVVDDNVFTPFRDPFEDDWEDEPTETNEDIAFHNFAAHESNSKTLSDSS